MIKKCLTFVLVCSVALAQGGAKCYQNYEADWFNCVMRYYEKIGPAHNTATTEKRLIDQWFDFEKNSVTQFSVLTTMRVRENANWMH